MNIAFRTILIVIVAAAGAALPLRAFATGPAQPQQIETMTDKLVEMMPFGAILDSAAAGDPAWPFNEKADAVTAQQLACMRNELSSAGYRRSKAAEAATYAQANAARFEADLKLITDASPLFGSLIAGGIAEGQGGPKFEAADAMKNATPDQLLAFMTFISDPKYAPLRELSGIGEAFQPGRSEAENQKAGEGIGATIVTKLMVNAMKTCDVSPAALFE